MTWKTYARRTHAPLSARLLQEAQRSPRFETLTGIPYAIRNHVWLGETIYIPTEEQDSLEAAVDSLIAVGDWSYLRYFADQCRESLVKLAATADFVRSEANAKRITRTLITEWFDVYRVAMTFVPTFRMIDRVISAQIPEDQVSSFLNGTGGHPTEESQERLDLDSIAATLRSLGDTNATGPEARALLEAHTDQYGWLAIRWYLGVPFTTADFRKRLIAMLSSNRPIRSLATPNPTAPLAEMDSQREIVNELAFLRTYRAEAINKSIWRASPFMDAIGSQLDLDYRELVHLLPDEILSAYDGSSTVDRKLIARRLESFGTLMINLDFSDLAGNAAVEKARERIVPSTGPTIEPDAVSTSTAAPALHGVAASEGSAVGRVRIVHTQADESKVESGDILVAVMTFPSLVASMQRAGAIVTDDGGLLSHAAVTARELGKPCLIDTRSATATFRDGDLVEVDCTAQTVRRVSSFPSCTIGGD